MQGCNGPKMLIILKNFTSSMLHLVRAYLELVVQYALTLNLLADLEGKTDLKIRALEIVEELRTKRADKQVNCCFFSF